MSKNSKKAEQKKKKRQERIRQEKHQRHVSPVTKSFWDDDRSDQKDDSRPMDTERWLRGHALSTGRWLLGMEELRQAAEALGALTPVIGPGESAAASASERAQELAFQAFESHDLADAVSLARAAAALDPTCIDARRFIIRYETQDNPAERQRRLLALLDEAEQALDQPQIFATHGKLSRLISARPFLRVLQILVLDAARDHDVERLLSLLGRYVTFDHTGAWPLIGGALAALDEDERWSCAARLRDRLTNRDVGRFLVDGLLALHQGDRRTAAELIRQACVLNPKLRNSLIAMLVDRYTTDTELGYEAGLIASGVQPLTDDLEDFHDWLSEGMPWMDDAARVHALKAYEEPVAALLGLGESALGKIDTIDYRQAHGIGPQQREQLERMLSDPVFHQIDSQSAEAFAPIHAWRALSQIGDVRSLPVLFAALLEPDVGDWDYEELPEVIGRFGAAALSQVMDEHRRHFVEPDDDESALLSLQLIMALIVERTLATRATVIERLRWVVTDRQTNRDTSRADAIEHLAALRAQECLPLIEQAFADQAVDTSYSDLPRVRRALSVQG